MWIYEKWYENKCSRIPRKTQFGFQIFGDPYNMENSYEKNETNLVLHYLERSDYMMNIGANVGYYTCLASSRGVKTVAIEPLARNLKYLYTNLETNGFSENVEVYPIALGNTIGIQSIYGRGGLASLIQGWYGQPTFIRERITINTLDNLFHDRFSGTRLLIIMDVEGYEKKILEQASLHLDLSPKPIWLLEIGIYPLIGDKKVFNDGIFDTFDFFYNNGYRAWIISETIQEVTKKTLQEMKEKDNSSTRNFIFLDENEIPPNLA